MFNKLVLILNCGSSSLKFSVVSSDNYTTKLSGIVEFLNLSQIRFFWKIKKKEYVRVINKSKSYDYALNYILTKILKEESKIFNNIACVGHRVVHGGVNLNKSVLITQEIIKLITDACSFAPLHNPINLLGIKASHAVLPHLKEKNVAVFDTSFHSSIPKFAYLYAIPYKFYKKFGIRKYGAHGISCQYSVCRSSELLQIELTSLNIIICHLGGGASVSVVKNGVCVDTSMGLTPLEGLIMGTRSGDIDPSVIFFMNKQLNLSISTINNILINKSGLLGLSGVSSDFRNLESEYNSNIRIKLAIDMFCYRLSKYISGYMSVVKGKLHGIVFTGGIGENSSLVRSIVISKLAFLNFKLNSDINMLMKSGKEGFINIKNTFPILVIPANEELIIAKESFSEIN
ncbi:acetate kinase [Buchnera aphidicola str. Bp (Baizongia pistaciae)]|uniref:Acetate kinase n=1 Tax=Buchnera aphidicola subsp. Baizongia pistaciae (strain Bp) TaxID=224915 RepID=ACKA_BUCBP|nr:acetate kinase [Buchnera aphidicola]Q89AS8.1 RecName: Full=Acetate kinase; AltName: Full=Acetokinase [Buchnera aphidicola str. Bp (Baizongia pistaciae)]AAO26897.1 acetate kinase [Buchnera aphidicola str. Bp (Baizongia pistaciae)]